MTVFQDKWRAAYWIILLQGLASALPWNVFITETEFFNLRAHQAPFNQVLANNFETINLLISTAGNLLGFLLYLPLHHVMSLDMQVLWPQIVTFVVMMASVVLTVQQSVSGNAFMAVILTSQLIMSIFYTTISGGTYHMASWLPSQYINGLSLGIGVAGTAASAMSFITLWAVPRGHSQSALAAITPAAFLYFLGSTAIILLAILTYYVFFMLPYVHSHSIPEVIAEWTAEGSKGLAKEPTNLRRESANFLRCKTRSMSTDSLSASLSRSLSELDRPLLANSEAGPMAVPTSFPTRFSNEPQLPASCPILEEHHFETPPERSQPRWFPLEESESDNESPTSPLALGASPTGSRAVEGRETCHRPEATSHAPMAEFHLAGGMHPQLCLLEAHHAGCNCCKALAAIPRLSFEGTQQHPISSSSSRGFGPESGSEPVENNGTAVADSSTLEHDKREGLEDGDDPPMSHVVAQLWDYCVILGLGIAVTAATFPGITSAICSERNAAVIAPCNANTPAGRFFGDLFVPFMFIICNASDLIGRLLAGIGPWTERPPPMWLLHTYSLLRIPASVPLLFCNIVTAGPWRLPVLFRSDAWPLGIAALLGVTNGHMQSLALMHAPSVLPKIARDRAGPLLNLALALGNTAGSLASFLLTYYLQRA